MKRRDSLAELKKAASTKVCVISMYETQSQFGKVEEGHLNESLLYECVNFPGNLFTIMTSHVGVVKPTNKAMPKLSPLKI